MDEMDFLTADELAARWRRSPRTLERWRARGTGPAWLRIMGRVLYPRDAVEAEERRAAAGREARR